LTTAGGLHQALLSHNATAMNSSVDPKPNYFLPNNNSNGPSTVVDVTEAEIPTRGYTGHLTGIRIKNSHKNGRKMGEKLKQNPTAE
jgi:hypothetical protein